MASCQYPIIDGPSSTQHHSMNLPPSNISPQNSMNIQPMASQMSDDEVSMYGDNNGYPTLSNLFAAAASQQQNTNIMQGGELMNHIFI